MTRKTSGSPYFVGFGRARSSGTPPAAKSSTDGTAASATRNPGAVEVVSAVSRPTASSVGGAGGGSALVGGAGGAASMPSTVIGSSGRAATNANARPAPAMAPAKVMATINAPQLRTAGGYRHTQTGV